MAKALLSPRTKGSHGAVGRSRPTAWVCQGGLAPAWQIWLAPPLAFECDRKRVAAGFGHVCVLATFSTAGFPRNRALYIKVGNVRPQSLDIDR